MIDNNFDLNLIKIFMTVCEQKSINKASEKLFISQPAVSYSIKKLENSLGCTLLKRLPKGCIPTEFGENFYDSCKSGLLRIEQGIIDCHKDNNIDLTLKIGANDSIIRFLVPKINNFCKLYPNIKIIFTEVISKRLNKYLERGDIDIAIMEEQNFENNNFLTTKLCEINYCFIANKNSSIKNIDSNNISKIKLAISKQDTSSREFFDKFCKQNSINIAPTFQMASAQSILEFVKNDLCIGFLPKQYIDNTVQVLKCEYGIPKSHIAVLTRKDENAFYINDFIDILKK